MVFINILWKVFEQGEGMMQEQRRAVKHAAAPYLRPRRFTVITVKSLCHS